MKIVGKIFLLVTGIIFIVTGIVGIVAAIRGLINPEADIIVSIIGLCVSIFTLFVGFAGTSCFFIATPMRVKRVTTYAIILLVLSIIDIITFVVVAVSDGDTASMIFRGIWTYIVNSATSVIYMLGALFLAKSYK